jgi:superfamily II DNA or RNA helicase
MATFELKDYQKEAVKKAVMIPYNLICIQTGKGKSAVGTFYSRILFKNNLVDKVIFCSTKTGVGSFKKAFTKRLGVEVNQYDDPTEVMNFLINDEKICIIKHSMLEKLGLDDTFLSAIKEVMTHHYQRIAIVLDEAHKLSNEEGVGHFAFMNLRFMFERISLHTATPYSSCLSQIYGLIDLIYPGMYYANKRDFFAQHIEERVIRDPKTYKVLRKEKVMYHHLKELRETLEKFTYFYYPPIDLHFKTYHTRLKDYTEYDALCMGVLSREDLEGENNKNNK